MSHVHGPASVRAGARYRSRLAHMLGLVGVLMVVDIVAGILAGSLAVLSDAGVGLSILPRASGLGRNAIRVVTQAAPRGVDIAQWPTGLASIQGVTGVHDLHVWTLTSEMPVASVDLKTADADPHRVLADAQTLMREQFSIPHANLHEEPQGQSRRLEIDW